MKIAVLISGGVDSAVVVHKLYNEGHDLTLFYIRIGRDDDTGDCNADEDIEFCRLIARKYGVELRIVELHQEYWDHVMAYALRTVKEGRTPNPDMMCNKLIKFGFFEQRWGKEFDKTATGHYASVKKVDGTYYLCTAPDPVKDQTDFLAQISQQQLSHLLFPLGEMDKAAVRQMAVEAQLPNANRKDSQGICFLGKIDYNDFLRRHLGERPGKIIDIETDRLLGEHKGYWFHTIGQRKGLGLSGGPWFVVKKDHVSNTLYVAHGYDTKLQYGHRLPLTEMHWISGNPFRSDTPIRVSFKNRHTPQFIDATLTPMGTAGEYMLDADENVQGIAPGQYAVIYTPNRSICLGSGLISAVSENISSPVD